MYIHMCIYIYRHICIYCIYHTNAHTSVFLPQTHLSPTRLSSLALRVCVFVFSSAVTFSLFPHHYMVMSWQTRAELNAIIFASLKHSGLTGNFLFVLESVWLHFFFKNGQYHTIRIKLTICKKHQTVNVTRLLLVLLLVLSDDPFCFQQQSLVNCAL